MKRKSDESRFVQFAMTAEVWQVKSAIETMRAILAERSPKPVMERKPRTPKQEKPEIAAVRKIGEVGRAANEQS
jgi:hypothetical protein